MCRYIYRDIRDGAENSTKTRTILAGCAVFLFVCTVWHKQQISVLLWCALNVFCLEMEIIGKGIVHSRFYGETKRLIGANACDRINAIFGSQLLMVSVVTNAYFIGGEDVGKVIAYRTFFDVDAWDYLVASSVIYCGYHACEFLARRELFVRRELISYVMNLQIEYH